MALLETDHLVVGAGASAMAFVDSLVGESDRDVVLVDRRHVPGGHWNDAYPFVRLHQPSAYYGVNSLPLGSDRIETDGPEAGFYERATASEICAYFQLALDRLLGTGRVRFFGMTDYVHDPSEGHVLVSRLTGERRRVEVRHSLVDATYLQSEVPLRHRVGFDVDEGVRLVPPNHLVDLGEWDGAVSGFTVLGGGKTGADACSWLLDNGVPPDLICWIRPRDSWFFDRATVQPLDQVVTVIEGVADDLQAAAEAETTDDLFQRLEASGRLLRLDPAVEPTMFRSATLSRGEAEALRTIEDVVRMGRVVRLGRDEIVLAGGRVRTDPGRVHVDCTASGLPASPARPVFEDGRITLQTMRIGLTTFNAAVIGHVEATRHDVAEKNRLCPPNVYPSTADDWLPTTWTSTRADMVWSEQPDLADWLEGARLNLAGGMRAHFGDPRMQAALTRFLQHREPGLANLERLMAPAAAT